jgi:hypothetical protein
VVWVDIEHRTGFMHAVQVHHGILYMQLNKGTMTTSVKVTAVLEVGERGQWGGRGGWGE